MTDITITHEGGRDIVWKHMHGWRAREDQYTVTLDGRRYRAACGAVWDRANGNGWGMDYLWREIERRGSWRAHNAGQTERRWVSVPRSQKAWRVIEDALIKHRAEHGYAQRPAPKETANG